MTSQTHPRTLQPIRENIPTELKRLPQWVLWRWELRDHKWTKPPYQASGDKADSTDPTTWALYEKVVQAFAGGGFAGIGFALSPFVKIVGWDLDHTVEPATGAIEPWAQTFIDQLQSYTEISPSGTGLRILVHGNLPPNGRHRGQVEVYETGRYITITGHHVARTPLTIEQRQDVITALHATVWPVQPTKPQILYPAPVLSLSDTELFDRVQRSKNGALFMQLWAGQWQGRYPSQSEADLAFCSQLMFWTGGDPARTDQLFRASSLMRDKWDERHFSSGLTYGQATVARALADMRGVYGQRPKATNNPAGVSDAENPGVLLFPGGDATAGEEEIPFKENVHGNSSSAFSGAPDPLPYAELESLWDAALDEQDDRMANEVPLADDSQAEPRRYQDSIEAEALRRFPVQDGEETLTTLKAIANSADPTRFVLRELKAQTWQKAGNRTFLRQRWFANFYEHILLQNDELRKDAVTEAITTARTTAAATGTETVLTLPDVHQAVYVLEIPQDDVSPHLHDRIVAQVNAHHGHQAVFHTEPRHGTVNYFFDVPVRVNLVDGPARPKKPKFKGPHLVSAAPEPAPPPKPKVPRPPGRYVEAQLLPGTDHGDYEVFAVWLTEQLADVGPVEDAQWTHWDETTGKKHRNRPVTCSQDWKPIEDEGEGQWRTVAERKQGLPANIEAENAMLQQAGCSVFPVAPEKESTRLDNYGRTRVAALGAQYLGDREKAVRALQDLFEHKMGRFGWEIRLFAFDALAWGEEEANAIWAARRLLKAKKSG